MPAKMKFILGGVVIVAALAWLGFVGFQESKAYYITVDEFAAMNGNTDGKTFKLAGDVVTGSIDKTKSQMEFVISSRDNKIKVRYVGSAIVPDTFKDGSKALVEGKPASDGTFQASHIEAKCASKYESEYDQKTQKSGVSSR
jgi:cytochrome c-type biogenesis protein CcmE